MTSPISTISCLDPPPDGLRAFGDRCAGRLAPFPATASPRRAYRLVNIGAGQPEKVTTLVDALEKALGVKAIRELKTTPPGDVVKTFAHADCFWRSRPAPMISLEEGVSRFVDWYRLYYN